MSIQRRSESEKSEWLLDSLFQGVQLLLIQHLVGSAWPGCPAHGSHPLEANEEGWRCSHSFSPPRRRGYDPPLAWEY